MQLQPHTRPLPNAAMLQAMNVDDLMAITLRLSDLLAEESAMLSDMRFKDLPKMHAEKMKLTALLETYQQRLASDPSFVAQANHKTREELLLLTDDLAFNVEDNFRKVSTARAVNARVMQAIMDTMGEQHRPGTYGRNGAAASMQDLALSMNLNQRA